QGRRGVVEPPRLVRPDVLWLLFHAILRLLLHPVLLVLLHARLQQLLRHDAVCRHNVQQLLLHAGREHVLLHPDVPEHVLQPRLLRLPGTPRLRARRPRAGASPPPAAVSFRRPPRPGAARPPWAGAALRPPAGRASCSARRAEGISWWCRTAPAGPASR